MKKSIQLITFILAIGFSSFAQTVDLEKGLIAHYPFNGNANDESGKGNNGTVYSASLTNDRNGKSNSAYYFNGRNAKITFRTNSINSNTYSISAWIKTSNAGSSYRGIVVKQLAVGLLLKDNRLMSFDWKKRIDKNSNISISDNSWHLVSLVLNSGIIKFYIDGKFRTSSSFSIHSQSEKFIIGSGGYKQEDQYFKGYIDDITIYNRALNEAEIQALYNDQEKVVDAPLITFNSPNTNYITTVQSSYKIKACIQSSEPLKRYNVYVNEYTNRGFNVVPSSDCDFKLEKTINLNEGNNKIKIVAENSGGSTTSSIYTIN